MDRSDPLSRVAVKKLLRSLNIHPSKRLGQNFLVDEDVLEAILAQVRFSSPETIVEIGAGLGVVTKELASIANRVVAVEYDKRLADYLQHTLSGNNNVEVHCEDILSLDCEARLGTDSAYVIGNIPYRITSAILEYLVENRRFLPKALLLTQKEVALKIDGSPGKDGSSLGVYVQVYGDVELIGEVPRDSFYPTPAVDSVLWSLEMYAKPSLACAPQTFFRLVKALYGKRRKMLRVVLRDLVTRGQVDEILMRVGVDPRIRAEKLSLSQLDKLAEEISYVIGEGR